MGPFIDPFMDNGFMLRALLAGVLVSIACAVVGTFVVLRGLAFIGDALAHGVLPGIAGALLIVACNECHPSVAAHKKQFFNIDVSTCIHLRRRAAAARRGALGA